MTLQASNYPEILNRLKETIRQKRLQAVRGVNSILLSIYHEIGNTILVQQKIEGWGTKIIDKLAFDLKLEFPDMKGFSIRNLKYMRAFAEAYSDISFMQPEVAQIQPIDNHTFTIVQPLIAQLPWSHHIIILNKAKTPEERLFYIQKSVDNGWSKNILLWQIESNLYNRQGKAITNFDNTLPQYQSDLAIETFKNPYIFDFLSISEEIQERELEKALIEHLKKFMLELGKGFAYVGNQQNLNVEGDDFFLDLLFYNYLLKCFVLFELKVGEFEPEYAGKLNFYVNALNEKLKGPNDNSTIGVLLCKTPNETVIKYSLKGIGTPIGVSDYELTQALPKQLTSGMPSVEELEEEINKETEKLKKPIESKIDSIKELLRDFKGEEAKEKRNDNNITEVFIKILLPLKHAINNILIEKIPGWFNEIEYLIWIGNMGHHTDEQAIEYLYKYKTFFEFKLEIKAKGFKKAGINAFDCGDIIFFKLDEYKFIINNDMLKPEANKDYLYHNIPGADLINEMAENFCEKLIDDIRSKLETIQPGN